MGLLKYLTIGLVAVVAYQIAQMNKTPPLPELDPNPWWGPGEPRDQSTKVRPFKIEIPKADVDDLKARLALPQRVTQSLEGVNFTYGVNSATFSVFLKHWKENYDWKKRELRLNSFPHFKTRIEGLDIHFMRASPAANSGKKVLPLLMLHGWPGSFVEFMDIVPLLTAPRADSEVVFDVICPSLPGYGFSQASSKPGMNTLAMAQIFVKLMSRLGFEKFYVQGGDWGSAIATDIATVFPEKLHGLHLNMVFANTPGTNFKVWLGAFLPSGSVMDPKLENFWYPQLQFWGIILREMGYAHLHATKPDTVGVALNNSPQGLAAYILEKFSTWTNLDNTDKPDGGLLDPSFPIKLDAILDNICVYWFSGSITSSMRLYSEYFSPKAPSFTLNVIPTSVPTGIAAFMNDLAVSPRNLAAHKFTDIVTYKNPPNGGHFAAMEAPKTLAEDIHLFVNALLTRERMQTQKQKPSTQKKDDPKAETQKKTKPSKK